MAGGTPGTGCVALRDALATVAGFIPGGGAIVTAIKSQSCADLTAYSASIYAAAVALQKAMAGESSHATPIYFILKSTAFQ